MDLAVGNSYKKESYDSLHSMAFLEVDPHNQESINNSLWEGKLPISLPPMTRLLLHTEEIVEVPKDCFGFVELRSTWARLGFIAPATVADPGFKGQLTLEIFNASRTYILIRPGDKIWSLALVKAVNEPIYEGRYQGQTGVTGAKALK